MSDRTGSKPTLVSEQDENRALVDKIGVDFSRARAALYIARAAGVDLWLSAPTALEFDAPPELPKRLSDALFLHVFLNGHAIAALLEAEGSTP